VRHGVDCRGAALPTGDAGEAASASAARSTASVSWAFASVRRSGAGTGFVAGVPGAAAGGGLRRALELSATLIVVTGFSSDGGNTLTTLSKSAA